MQWSGFRWTGTLLGLHGPSLRVPPYLLLLACVACTWQARFWTEIYDGAKLFYLSGIQHGAAASSAHFFLTQR